MGQDDGKKPNKVAELAKNTVVAKTVDVIKNPQAFVTNAADHTAVAQTYHVIKDPKQGTFKKLGAIGAKAIEATPVAVVEHLVESGLKSLKDLFTGGGNKDHAEQKLTATQIAYLEYAKGNASQNHGVTGGDHVDNHSGKQTTPAVLKDKTTAKVTPPK